MSKFLRWVFAFTSMLGAIGSLVGWTLYHAARQEPEFYQQALLVEPARQAEVGDEFEHEVLELRNETRESGEWQAEFTTEELNGWLAADLPEKFPAALPAGLENPRVAIEDGLLRVAARYRDKTVSSVLSFALQIQLAEEPNMLAVRILEVRAGALPIPISGWLEKVQKAIRRTDLVVRWSQSDGDPVALVEIPDQPADQSDHLLTLETIAIEEGVVRLSGSTTPPHAEHKSSPEKSAVVQRTPVEPAGENEITHR